MNGKYIMWDPLGETDDQNTVALLSIYLSMKTHLASEISNVVVFKQSLMSKYSIPMMKIFSVTACVNF
jgi:hypothetical protein